MREIALWGPGGEFVAVVEIAPFPDDGLPEVVIWGTRTFSRGVVGGLAITMGLPYYREVFAYVSLTPAPGGQKPPGVP